MGANTTAKTIASEGRSVALIIRDHGAVEHDFIDNRLKGMTWDLKISRQEATASILRELDLLGNVPAKLVTEFRTAYGLNA